MTAPYVKKCFYCIAATEEPRLYEDCITIGITPLHGFTHLLARRFHRDLCLIFTIARYVSNPAPDSGIHITQRYVHYSVLLPDALGKVLP